MESGDAVLDRPVATTLGSPIKRPRVEESGRSVGVVHSRRPSLKEEGSSTGTVRIYSASKKHEWRLDTPPSVRNLIIADSNFRGIDTVPEGWCLVVLPGAKFRHVMEALERGREGDRSRLEVVYLQVGVNHRDERGLAEPEIRETLRCLRKVAKTVRYVGISCTRALPGRESENILNINRKWKELADEYVYPISSSEVRIRTDDRFAIHHDAETLGKVMRSVLEFHEAHASTTSDVSARKTTTPKDG